MYYNLTQFLSLAFTMFTTVCTELCRLLVNGNRNRKRLGLYSCGLINGLCGVLLDLEQL